MPNEKKFIENFIKKHKITKTIKTGDLVEVDADKGVVKIIKKS